MSSLGFACALVCLVAAMALGTSGPRRRRRGSRSLVACRRCTACICGPSTGTKTSVETWYRKPLCKAPGSTEMVRLVNAFGTVNIGGFIIIDATGGIGTYTVAADCTGTISITDGPSFNIYVGPGGQQLWTTQIGGGAGAGSGLGVGTGTRMP